MRNICLLLLLGFACQLKAQQLYTMPDNAQSSISSFENINGLKGQGGKTNKTAKGNAFEPLKAGETKTLLDVKGAGIVQRMWFTVNDRSPAMLRSLRLRMFWDGHTKPAVDVPFGDFFAVGLGKTAVFQSALFTNPEGRSFNCYIPMPFKTAARIIITNESSTDLPLLFFDIDFLKKQPPANSLYFHAAWHREITSDPVNDFELLPLVKGRGRFLGVNVGVNADTTYGTTWWGEGEVKMFIDGDSKLPTINGTGTEDYIGTGWGQGAYNHLYQGCTVADEKTKQYCFYRFHVPDEIYFETDFKATIQKIGGGDYGQVKELQQKGVKLIPVSVATDTGFVRLFEVNPPLSLQDSNFPKGWVNFYRIDDYSATAYFYLDKPVSNLPPLSPVTERAKNMK
ncbi:glycoside hydrolase family 172 protein [Foetidibacter luteolus]|uniref:glycoside hydrolase family 172 protein n=1 Tax=Foetidibacter luteolus TaxID=2608880 RepID=UPI00129BA9C6|nr:glycoside hydrolase family 172 protein [Foetidibacter luteolus]